MFIQVCFSVDEGLKVKDLYLITNYNHQFIEINSALVNSALSWLLLIYIHRVKYIYYWFLAITYGYISFFFNFKNWESGTHFLFQNPFIFPSVSELTSASFSETTGY